MGRGKWKGEKEGQRRREKGKEKKKRKGKGREENRNAEFRILTNVLVSILSIKLTSVKFVAIHTVISHISKAPNLALDRIVTEQNATVRLHGWAQSHSLYPS